jgi:hypothetical protein
MRLWTDDDSDYEQDAAVRDPATIDETVQELRALLADLRWKRNEDQLHERARRRMGRAIAFLAAREGWHEIAVRFGHFDGEACRREWGWAVRARYGTSHLRGNGGPLDVHLFTMIVLTSDENGDRVEARVGVDDDGPVVGSGWIEQQRWRLTAAHTAELWEMLDDDPALDVYEQANWFYLVRAIRARAAVAKALGVQVESEWYAIQRGQAFDPPAHGTEAIIRAVRDVYGDEAAQRQGRALGVRVA